MSQLWVNSATEPRNSPVNMDQCHSIGFQDDPAVIAACQQRADKYAEVNPDKPRMRVFNIFFYSGSGMHDEECTVQWQFAEYDHALAAYNNLIGLAGVMSI